MELRRFTGSVGFIWCKGLGFLACRAWYLGFGVWVVGFRVSVLGDTLPLFGGAIFYLGS